MVSFFLYSDLLFFFSNGLAKPYDLYANPSKVASDFN